MIDTAPDFQTLLKQRERIVNQIKDISIVHICCCCGDRLETHWDNVFKLDGRWMALEVDGSELFGTWVADPQRILCNRCFGTGEWKKKGIKLR